VTNHDHDHAAPGQPLQRGTERRPLLIALFLTGTFMVAEVVAGVLAGSLALLADAGHMLTDAAALGLSLFAMWFARRPPTPEKTYGYLRLEILAALVNGAALIVISGLIVWEAWERLGAPRIIDARLMMVVAALGLAVNLFAARLLHRHVRGSLNVRGAYLHVLGDILGSVGTLGAGAVIVLTGWTPADPLVSIGIALLILISAWRLVREATDILLEAAPPHVDVSEIVQSLASIPNLHDVHDLHVWSLTSGFIAMSGHGVLDDPRHQAQVLAEISRRMQRLGIEHVTFQLEPRALYTIPSRGDASAGPGSEGDIPRRRVSQ